MMNCLLSALMARRPLTSAWIETSSCCPDNPASNVALSRVRGLKPIDSGRNESSGRRTLTSAWIETPGCGQLRPHGPVALSRVRGLKHCCHEAGVPIEGVALSRVRGLKLLSSGCRGVLSYVALSRVRGLKPSNFLSPFHERKSHSHECVD